MEKLYTYFSCDEWKSHSSSRLIGVFTESKLREIILEDLENGDIELCDIDDINSLSINDINNLIVYGMILEIEINERL